MHDQFGLDGKSGVETDPILAEDLHTILLVQAISSYQLNRINVIIYKVNNWEKRKEREERGCYKSRWLFVSSSYIHPLRGRSTLGRRQIYWDWEPSRRHSLKPNVLAARQWFVAVQLLSLQLSTLHILQTYLIQRYVNRFASRAFWRCCVFILAEQVINRLCSTARTVAGWGHCRCCYLVSFRGI